ncbi:MAG: AAA family ATPase [Methylotenera sp.]|nr:AAA family ATPase [Methylotenera sp.]
MLIEFKVTNFRSIRETQTLSMVASTDRDLVSNTFDTGVTGLPKLLRSAAIYGPNAAGKSNIIAALAFVENMVTDSAREAQVGEPIDIQPFRLSSASRDQDTEFELHFAVEGVRYQYGFTLNRERITSEWLTAYPLGAPQRWFQRAYDVATKKDVYKFSDLFDEGKLRQERANYTIANNLYLSVAVQKNSQKLLPVFTWFQKTLQYILSMSHIGSARTARMCLESEGKNQVLAHMNAAGIKVKDVNVDKRIFSESDLPEDFPDELKPRVLKEMQDAVRLETRFLYQENESENLIPFDLDDESDGTRALFAFASRWIDMLKNDEVLFIDEIDSSLHPLLVHHLVSLLNCTNSKSQLIFTTHDTTLLSQHMMRRDQVWFVEKDQQQSTQLYSLAEFSPRKNEAIEKGYLNGRYGAIPFLSKLDFYG